MRSIAIDLYGELQKANTLNFEEVKAVVFESTGDISVFHGKDDKPLETVIFASVIGAEHLF